MPPTTANDKKVREVRRLIRKAREQEEALRDGAPSRSTGIRNVYKASHTLVARIEDVLKA